MDEKPPRKRPIWVWFISIYFVLSTGWVMASFYLISTGSIPLSPDQAAYFNSITTVDYALTIGLGLCNLIGAFALFLLRKVALYFFVTALGVNLLFAAWETVTTGWVKAIGGSGLVGALIGFVVAIAVCIYAWRLTRKGTLR